MSLGLSFVQRQELSPQQLLNQRLAQKFELTQELIATIYDSGQLIYQPNAVCPKCRHELTSVEILRGFRPVPTDPTTRCPKCKHRFQARLLAHRGSTRAEIIFLCPCQTLSQLQFWRSQGKSWDKFEKSEHGVYRSALIHFGSLKSALSLIGVLDYEEPPTPNWQSKVRPFLGQLPDAVIARTVKQPASAIRRFRLGMGIEACDRKYGED